MTTSTTDAARAARPGPRRVRSAGAWCAPITGFRGVAAILVVVGHTFMATRTYPFTSVIHVIGLIVPTFFVISAYALYRPFLLADVEGEPVPSARSFWWKRFLRIYPLYATALTLYLVALPGVRPHGGRIADYAKLYGFLQVYDPDLAVFSGIPAAWFLCDEVAFYLFLPVIALAARSVARRGGRTANARRRLRSHVTVAIGMIVVGTVARTYLVLTDFPAATSLPVSNLDYYGFGILLAAGSIGERRGVAMPHLVEWLRRRPAVALGALVVGCLTMNVVAQQPGASFSSREDLGRYTLYTLMVVPLMVVMVFGEQEQGFNRWLGSKRWSFLALLSLHAYLWHQLLLGGFDRFVTEIAEVRWGPRPVTGAILATGAVVATVAWAAAWRPLLDQPYQRWKRAFPRPAGAPPRPAWVRPAATAAVVVLLAGGTVAALRYGGSPVEATGGVHLVTVTHADPGDDVLVRRAGHRRVVADGRADGFGAFVAHGLAPGRYEVEQRRDGRTIIERSATVLAVDDVEPDDAADQQLSPGLTEITTRDGTRLSAYVELPGPASKGPYPTVVEYTAYQAADRKVAQPATAAARAMGYATVAVNVRGTGCSGGAFDLFSEAQAADGYDVVQAVAAQDWVAGHRVGLVGFSYGGLAALQVAATRPPALEGVLALSVYGDAWQAFHPGGLANAGFPVGWLRDLQADAEPSGADWVRARIAGGDRACERNQLLHHQQADIGGTYLGDVPDDGRFDGRSPSAWAPHIDVPVLLSSEFQDTTLGADLAEHLDAFRAPVKLVLGNGTHGDGVAPQILARMSDFLGLYVGRMVPEPLDTAALLAETRPDVDPDVVPDGPRPPTALDPDDTLAEAVAAYEAGPPVEVLWESGATEPFGATVARWSTGAEAWPPEGTTATTWHLTPEGRLSPDVGPADATAARFRTDPTVAAVPYSTEGSTLITNEFVGFDQPPRTTNAAWVGPALPDDTAMAGTASVDLWVRTDRTDADLQVVLLDVSARGDETLVQTGWLRASQRSLLPESTDLRPVVDFSPEAQAPLVPDRWTEVRIRLGSFAHVFRAGSRIRLLVGTPGGSQVQWSFGPPPDGSAQVDVGQGGEHGSALVLPVAAEVPGPGAAACGVLRGQPCRPYRSFANTEVPA